MSGAVGRIPLSKLNLTRVPQYHLIPPKRGKRPIVIQPSFHVKVGDYVQVCAGQDKGKQGNVKSIIKHKNSVIVGGLKLFTKNVRMNDGRCKPVKMEAKIHVSNVMHVDPEKKKPTKLKIMFTKEGKKVRVSKLSGSVIPKIKLPQDDKKRSPAQPTEFDTSVEEAEKSTYNKNEDFVRVDPIRIRILKNKGKDVSSHKPVYSVYDKKQKLKLNQTAL